MIPEEDFERAKRKCNEIADILKAPTALAPRDLNPTTIALREVLKERCAEVWVDGDVEPVEVDRELCSLLVWGLQDAFSVLAPIDRILLSDDGPAVKMVVKGNTPFHVPADKQRNMRFDNMTECIAQYLQRDSLGAIFVDAIADELEIPMELELLPSTSLTLLFPKGVADIKAASNA